MESFGWDVITIDGHNFEDIFNAFNYVHDHQIHKPIAIIAHTIKGKGISLWKTTRLACPHAKRNRSKKLEKNYYGVKMVNSTLDMRDAFFKSLYTIAKNDKSVMLLSNDFGAPSLDIFRKELASQYLNCGISEQNMISVAAGLALSEKKVYIYGILPFVTLRCLEQIKIDLCKMKLPVVIVGVGAGYAYESAGPTHHGIDDIGIMRMLEHLTILNRLIPYWRRICRVFLSHSFTDVY